MNSVSLESHSSCPSWRPWTLTRSPIAPKPLCSTVLRVLVVKHRERAFSFTYSFVHCSPNIHLAVSLHSWHLVRLTLGSRIPREQQVSNQSPATQDGYSGREGPTCETSQRTGLCDRGKSPVLTPVSPISKLSLFLRNTGHAPFCSLLKILKCCLSAPTECLKILPCTTPRLVLHQRLLRASGSEVMLFDLRAGLPGKPLRAPVAGDSGTMQPSPPLDKHPRSVQDSSLASVLNLHPRLALLGNRAK